MSDKTRLKILGFKELEKGWYYTEGEPFKEEEITRAIDLDEYASLLGFSATDAFPDITGGIMITIYHGQHYLEFTLEGDGTVTFCEEHEDEDDDVRFKEGLSIEQAKAILKESWSKWSAES